MTAWELYFLLMLDNWKMFFITLYLFTGIGGTFAAIFISFPPDDWDTKARYIPYVFLPIFLVSLLISTILPSTKQMAAIMVVPAIINNEKIQKLPNEILNLLGMSIDKAKEMLEKPNDSQ